MPGGSHQRERVVATVGVFDGLHRGHQVLLAEVVARARREAALAAAVTFDPPPQAVITGRTDPFQITPWPEKRSLLTETGLDRLLLVCFDRRLAERDGQAFIEEILLREYSLAALVIGYDFRFGAGGRGDLTLLRAIGEAKGFPIQEVGVLTEGDEPISSTRIRGALREGAVAAAARLLGRPFAIGGPVVGGRGLGGRALVPTANVRPVPEQLLPAGGVYLVRAGRDGELYDGLAHVGPAPTVESGEERVIEVHLLDFQGDLRGEQLRVHFLERMRPTRRFRNLAALRAEIARDLRRARQWFGSLPGIGLFPSGPLC